MALLDIDELNLIDTYFDEMELSEEDKKNRVDLCEDLFYIYYYIFALISADFRLKKTIRIKDYTNDLSKRFRAVLNATEYAEILDDEEISDYIDEVSENLVKSTLRNLPVDETKESVEQAVIPVNPYWSSTERAIRVAEDMTNVIANYAELEEKKAEGYTHKTWISILDTKTRPSHWLAWGKTVPIDEPFEIGTSKMMCPCDHTAPAKEIVNCRCKLVYSIKNNTLKEEVPSSKVEFGVIYDKNGKMIYCKIGEVNGIGFEPEELKMVAGNIVVHNHPNFSSFSNEDIAFAFQHNPSEIRVSISNHGYYYLRVPQNISEETRRLFKDVEWVKAQRNALKDELHKKVDELFENGIIKRSMRNATLSHLVNQSLLDKYGIEYGFKEY